MQQATFNLILGSKRLKIIQTQTYRQCLELEEPDKIYRPAKPQKSTSENDNKIKQKMENVVVCKDLKNN